MTESPPPSNAAGQGATATPASGMGGAELAQVTAKALAESHMATSSVVVEQIRSQGRTAEWPGGVLGLLGFGLIIWTLTMNMNENLFEPVEYVATLMTGALLALLGPLIIAKSVSRTQEALQKMDEQTKAAAWADIAASLDRAGRA